MELWRTATAGIALFFGLICSYSRFRSLVLDSCTEYEMEEMELWRIATVGIAAPLVSPGGIFFAFSLRSLVLQHVCNSIHIIKMVGCLEQKFSLLHILVLSQMQC